MKRQLTLSINDILTMEIKKQAIDEGTNLSAITERLYQEYLEKIKTSDTNTGPRY